MNSPEVMLKKTYNQISKNDLFVFVVSAIICFFVHLYTYVNILSAHDATPINMDSTGFENGRFMVSLLFPILSRINIPVLIGLLTCFLLATAVVIITKIFNIKSKFFAVILSAIIISHPAIVASHFYFTSAFIYAFALLTSVIAVYVIDKHKIWGPIGAFALLILSLGSYQAYIDLFLGLLIAKLMVECSKDNKIVKIISTGIKYVVTASVSMVVYFLLWKMIPVITGTEIAEYRNYSDVPGSITNNFMDNFGDAFCIGVDLFFTNYFKYSSFFYVIYVVLCISALFSTMYLAMKNKSKTVFFIPMLYLMLVFATGFIYILSPQHCHLLMVFAAVCPFILVVKNLTTICEDTGISVFKTVFVWVLTICLIATSLNQIVLGNTLYTKMAVNYNHSLSYCTRLVDRIEQVDGFDKYKKVVLVGEKHGEIHYGSMDFWPEYIEAFLFTDCGLTYLDTVVWFIQQNMVTNINISYDAEQSTEYMKKKAVKELSPFPAKDCMIMVDGVLVVRLN